MIDRFICINLMFLVSTTNNKFLANNLFVYIEKDIISLLSIQSIMNKLPF